MHCTQCLNFILRVRFIILTGNIISMFYIWGNGLLQAVIYARTDTGPSLVNISLDDS